MRVGVRTGDDCPVGQLYSSGSATGALFPTGTGVEVVFRVFVEPGEPGEPGEPDHWQRIRGPEADALHALDGARGDGTARASIPGVPG